MLCAVRINGQVELVEENQIRAKENLLNYNELLDEMCCGFEIGNMTMVKDGAAIWNEEECELDFIKFRC